MQREQEIIVVHAGEGMEWPLMKDLVQHCSTEYEHLLTQEEGEEAVGT